MILSRKKYPRPTRKGNERNPESGWNMLRKSLVNSKIKCRKRSGVGVGGKQRRRMKNGKLRIRDQSVYTTTYLP